MSSVSNTINSMQNQTAEMQAQQAAVSGANQELNQDMFLRLMLEQLKYQDPLDPMSNQEFLAQQAQFTQLNELQKLNESITANNTVTQAVSLVGKEVTLVDPDDNSKTIVGIVEEATFDASGTSIKVNGKNYPLGYVMGIREPGSSSDTSTAEGGGEGDIAEEDGEENAFLSAINYFLDNSSKIVGAVGDIAKKIAEYVK